MNYRFLFSARWVRLLAFTVVAVIVCVLLAMWQGDRREQRLEEIRRVTSNYDAPVQPLGQVLANTDSPLAADAEWTRVQVQGRYLPALTQLARNRPLDAQSGFEVVVPLELDDGRTIAVSRGWVPTNDTGGVPESVPPPPSGTVTVTMRLRPAQDGSEDNNPDGVILAVDPQRIPGMDDGYTGAYGVLDSETPPAAETPKTMPRPSTEEGSNLSYMMQWFAFGLLLIIGVIYAARKEAEALAEGQAPEAAGAAPPHDFEVVDKDLLLATQGKAYKGAATQASDRYGRPTKAKKSRRSADETFEDDYLDSRGL